MIQDLINAFNNESNKGAKFVAFEYTNRFGEKAGRLIQINTKYENALKKDLTIIPTVEYVATDDYDRATFITAQAELLKSVNLSLGNTENANKTDIEMHKNRSEGQTNAYVQIAPNIQFNLNTQALVLFGKEIRKNVITEGEYPETNKRAKTKAKDFIRKKMVSTKYRKYHIANIESITVNGDTIELN
jgi:hypothetical protein